MSINKYQEIFQQLFEQFEETLRDPDITRKLQRLPGVDETVDDIQNKLLNLMRDLNGFDANLQELISDMGGISEHKYNETHGTIPDEYVIVYFPSAKMMKVYAPTEIDDFLKHIRTNFRNIEYYEVVRDSHKQKIILIYDSIDDEELARLKKHIVNFCNQFLDEPILDLDVLVIKDLDSGQSELILNKYFVNNISEKELFCQKMMEYITDQEKNSHIS